MDATHGNLKNLSEAQRAALEDMTTAMINKLLHTPISQLKRNSGDEDEDSALYVAALKKLFDLEEKRGVFASARAVARWRSLTQ